MMRPVVPFLGQDAAGGALCLRKLWTFCKDLVLSFWNFKILCNNKNVISYYYDLKTKKQTKVCHTKLYMWVYYNNQTKYTHIKR